MITIVYKEENEREKLKGKFSQKKKIERQLEFGITIFMISS